MAEAAKTLSFTYEGKMYTLEFDRKRVRALEQRGFNINELDVKPITLLPMLFWGAFQKNHKGITRDTTDAILEKMKNRDSLFDKLAEMYVAPVNSLFDEPDESEGNVSWDTSW